MGAVLGAVLAVVGAVLPEVVRVDGYSASYLSGVCASGLGTLAQALDAKVRTDCSELAALNDVAHGLLAVGLVVLLASIAWLIVRGRSAQPAASPVSE
jgi:hypothetical protein